MKPTMLFALLLGLLLYSVTVLGQNPPRQASIISAKTVIVSKDKKIVTLENDVSIKTDLLFIRDAKKVQIDNIQNKIIVFGEAAFEFSGQIVVLSSDGSKERRLEYTIGEQIAYLK